MKMKVILGIILFLLVIGIIVLTSSAYIVQETEQVIVTEFGEPVGDAITEAGLHWRTPFIQKIHRFDKRILAFSGSAEEIPTRDKEYIFVDTFARWRIKD